MHPEDSYLAQHNPAALRDRCYDLAAVRCGPAAPVVRPEQDRLLDELIANPSAWPESIRARGEHRPDDLAVAPTDSGDEELSIRLYKAALATAGRLGAPDPEDVASEVACKLTTTEGRPALVSAILKKGDPSERGKLCVSYTRRAAHNEAVDWYRKHRRSPSLDPLSEAQKLQWESTVKDPQPCVEQVLHNKQAVQVAFEKLDASDREILWLKYVEGLSSKEIAEMKGITENAVNQRIFRAMKKIIGEGRSATIHATK